MRHTARIISIHASDTAGVCSMLYELGGMTVVHDASGCNSTYATHDEPRWQHKQSNIFISALTETDAILGNDEKFINDVTETAMSLKPRFIAICCSPIPVMVGTDMDALAMEIGNRSGIPTLSIPTSGMGSWLDGASAALLALCRRFCVETAPRPDTINILGATPLDLSRLDTPASLRSWAAENGLNVNAIMAMDTDLEQISHAACASANLVISSSGLAAARYLQQRFGTPYLAAFPVGTKFASAVAEHLREATVGTVPEPLFDDSSSCPEDAAVIVGEPVFSVSLAAALKREYDCHARVLSPFTFGSEILRTQDRVCEDETELEAAFSSASALYSDPMYLPLWQRSKPFHALPCYAFSGRCYRKHFPVLVNTPPEFPGVPGDFTTRPQE